MIRYRLLPCGGFVAGDTETRRTAYAYWSSVHATAARRHPAKVAATMLRSENAMGANIRQPVGCAYDRRNWESLTQEFSTA